MPHWESPPGVPLLRAFLPPPPPGDHPSLTLPPRSQRSVASPRPARSALVLRVGWWPDSRLGRKTCSRVCTHTRTDTRRRTHSRIHAQTHAHMHTRAHSHEHTRTHEHMHSRAQYTHTHSHAHAHTLVHTCTYMQTHTHSPWPQECSGNQKWGTGPQLWFLGAALSPAPAPEQGLPAQLPPRGRWPAV